jgi:hypothetical protein
LPESFLSSRPRRENVPSNGRQRMAAVTSFTAFCVKQSDPVISPCRDQSKARFLETARLQSQQVRRDCSNLPSAPAIAIASPRFVLPCRHRGAHGGGTHIFVRLFAVRHSMFQLSLIVCGACCKSLCRNACREKRSVFKEVDQETMFGRRETDMFVGKDSRKFITHLCSYLFNWIWAHVQFSRCNEGGWQSLNHHSRQWNDNRNQRSLI